jgi:hypothetical protein
MRPSDGRALDKTKSIPKTEIDRQQRAYLSLCNSREPSHSVYCGNYFFGTYPLLRGSLGIRCGFRI